MWAQAEDENRNPVMVEVTDNVILGLYIANSINLAINVIGILIVTLSILVFYRRPLFHYNLVCLMTCGYFSGIFMTAAGIANSIAGFLDLSILTTPSIYPENPIMMGIESIRGWSIYLALFMASCVVFERVWATINLQSYQNTYNPQAVAIILISTWILSLLMFILSFCLRYYRVTIFIIFLMSLFNGIAFNLCYKYNVKRLETLKRQTSTNYILSQRYQLSENIRVFKMLKQCVIGFVASTSVVVIFVFVMLNFIGFELLNAREYVIREGLHVIIAVACNVICLCAITGTYVWREMLKLYLKRLFIWKRLTRRVHQSDENVEDPTKQQNRLKSQVKSTDGVQLTFKDEADIYFRQLDLVWK